MNFNVKWIKPLPVEKIMSFEDKVVFTCARLTLDFTNPHFPYLTGDLARSSMAKGVSKRGDKTYSLGYNSYVAPYAKEVWNYSQKSTNWTNTRSYSKWYLTEWKNQKQTILGMAVTRSYKS